MARSSAALCRALVRRGHAVTVATALLEPDAPLEESRDGVRVRRFRGPDFLKARLVPWAWGLREFLRRELRSFDVTHLHGHRNGLADRGVAGLPRGGPAVGADAPRDVPGPRPVPARQGGLRPAVRRSHRPAGARAPRPQRRRGARPAAAGPGDPERRRALRRGASRSAARAPASPLRGDGPSAEARACPPPGAGRASLGGPAPRRPLPSRLSAVLRRGGRPRDRLRRPRRRRAGRAIRERGPRRASGGG